MTDEIMDENRQTKDRKKEVFENKMKNDVDGESYLFAMLLLDEAVKKAKEFPSDDLNERFKRAKYAIMDYADKMKMISPFHDDDSLREAFDAAMELDEMDWDWGFEEESRAGLVPRMPKTLMDLYKSCIRTETGTILVAEAEKLYPYLEMLIDGNKGVEFVLTTQNDVNRRALLAALGRLDLDNVQIIAADVYEKGFTKEKADLIFALPSGRGVSMGGTFATIAAVNNLLCNLNEGARLVVTVPGKVIGSSRDDCRELRRKISQDNRLREMSELPAGLFDYTALKTCLLDIERTEPKGDDDVAVRRYALTTAEGEASNADSRPRRLGWRGRETSRVVEIKVDDEIQVKAKELWNDETWNISMRLSVKDAAYEAFYGSSVPKVKLETVASVGRGWAIYERESGGDVGLLSISNLAEDGINVKNLDRIRVDDEKRLESYRLKDGDLLVSARGTAVKTAVFRDPGLTCVASVNLIVIRPKDNPVDENGQELPRLNPVYLKIFLDSELGEKLLRGMQQGERLMNMSHRDLDKLLIPLPSREEQDEKAQEYEKEYRAYREAVDEATRSWNAAKEKLQKF